MNKKNMICKIHGVGSALGMKHNEIRLAADVDSLLDLSYDELCKLYHDLCQRNKIINGISALQMSNIYRIGYRELKWTGYEILKFIKKQTGYMTRIENLSRKDATKVINGMEAVSKYRREKN